MGSFGNSLKNYREQHNVTKLALAKGIGTSDAYIRQIENQGYKPPTFEVCEKIAAFLNLNQTETEELFEQAFIERIESEKKFYDMLKTTLFVKTKPSSLPDKTNSTYQITWHLRKLIHKKLISITSEIKAIIESSISINKITATNITIENDYISFEITTDNIMEIKQIMPSIMKMASSKIKNNYPGFSSTPSIWKNNFDISKPEYKFNFTSQETHDLVVNKR